MKVVKRRRLELMQKARTPTQGKLVADLVQKAPKLRAGGRSQQIAERVEKATREILAEGTVNDVTFEAIAARADVNRATLRRRWGDKWRLVTWVTLEVMSREAPVPDTGSLRDDVLAAMLNLDKTFSDSASAAVFQVLFVESRSDPAIAKAVEEYWIKRFDQLHPMFDRAVERGELPKDANFEFTMEAIYGAYFYHALRTGQPISADYAIRLVDAAMIIVQAIDLR